MRRCKRIQTKLAKNPNLLEATFNHLKWFKLSPLPYNFSWTNEQISPSVNGKLQNLFEDSTGLIVPGLIYTLPFQTSSYLRVQLTEEINYPIAVFTQAITVHLSFICSSKSVSIQQRVNSLIRTKKSMNWIIASSMIALNEMTFFIFPYCDWVRSAYRSRRMYVRIAGMGSNLNEIVLTMDRLNF